VSGVKKPRVRKKSRVSRAVLDASALLALVQGETGAEKVGPMIAYAVMSAVNYCETVQRLRRGGMPLEAVTQVLTSLVAEPVAFDRETAYVAAAIHEKTRGQGISFGDCACLALAMMRSVPAVTADRKWDRFDVGVKVIQIR
jgi:ribonuclease VapC